MDSDDDAPNLGGRPTAFRPEYVEQARKLAQLGATNTEVADFFEVGERAIYRWRIAHPEFAESLRAGKEAADDRVEQSLYHRAVGYSHPAVKIQAVAGEIVETGYTEHYPPDTTAAIFWLKNRRREQWRDSSQIDHSSSDGSMSPQPPVYNITDK